jgi:hypothetical protein
VKRSRNPSCGVLAGEVTEDGQSAPGRLCILKVTYSDFPGRSGIHHLAAIAWLLSADVSPSPGWALRGSLPRDVESQLSFLALTLAVLHHSTKS